MKERDILDHLRQKIEEVPVPFEEADWNAMQAMLDRREQKKIIAFRPSYNMWKAAGIAAAVLLAGVFMLTPWHKKQVVERDVAQHQSEKQNSQSPAPERKDNTLPAVAAERVTPSAKTADKVPMAKQRSDTPGEALRPDQNDWIAGATENKDTVMHREQQPSSVITAKDVMTAKTEEKRKPVQKIDFSEFEERKATGLNKPYFIAGGGVLTGDRSLGYSLSTAVVKGLSKKLSLQAGVAYVYNDLKRDINQMTITSRTVSGIGGPEIEYDTTFARVNSRLPQNYAQAEVSLNLALLKNSNLLMGVDVQRLMRSKQEVDAINNSLIDQQQLPLWNSGVKLRYQYAVIKNLALGLAYRFDVTSTFGNKQPNNFTQAYIIYQFKK